MSVNWNNSMLIYLRTGCSSFDAVLDLLSAARSHLNEILSAFEFIDAEAMSSVTAHLQVSNPISASGFYVLLETSGSNAAHDEHKLQLFLDRVMSSGLVIDGTIATAPSKIKVCCCCSCCLYYFLNKIPSVFYGD